MLTKFHDLQYVDANKFTHLAIPMWDSNITLDSPAIEVMTDFRRQPAVATDYNIPAIEAKQLMERAHVSLQFVLKEGIYQGIVTLRYLQSRKVMVKMQELGVKHHELTVGDVMLHKNRTHALCFDSVKNARIGDVLHTLQSLGESHVIVVSADDNDADIVGVISAVEIAQYLNLPPKLFQSEKTFLSLVHALRDHAAS